MSIAVEHKEYGDRYYITEEQAEAIAAIIGIPNQNFCHVVTQPHAGNVREVFEPEEAK